ncbi:MAG: class IV adenylate cyclase [Planctomycetia bacterium]|nr:class IV adenylate cyclase [Planctomycetia bacterium]
MSYEVEMKFPLPTQADVDSLRERIAQSDAVAHESLDQRDVYLAHPSRDFVQTDEVFRLRHVGEQNYLTYKGPVVDAETKTRREIEVAAASGPIAAAQLLDMLTSLGFRPVGEVIKRRTPFHLSRQGREIEIVLDDVRGLGWFVELETIADEASCDAARECLFELSRELEFGKSERRSYLRLLLRGESHEL